MMLTHTWVEDSSLNEKEHICFQCGLIRTRYFVRNLPRWESNRIAEYVDAPECNDVVIRRVMES